MSKARTENEEGLAQTTVVMDGYKYRELRKILVDRRLTFREWLDEQLDREISRLAKAE